MQRSSNTPTNHRSAQEQSNPVRGGSSRGSNANNVYPRLVMAPRPISGGQGLGGGGQRAWEGLPPKITQKTCIELANNDTAMSQLLLSNYQPEKKPALQEMVSKITTLINENQHSEALKQLDSILESEESTHLYPFVYKKMALILLNSQSSEYNPMKGADCLKKAEIRIEKTYFLEHFGDELGKKEKKEFDKLKMLTQFKEKFPQRINKRKREIEAEDRYSMSTPGLTVFLFDNQNRNSVLSNKPNTINHHFNEYQAIIQKRKLLEDMLKSACLLQTACQNDPTAETSNKALLDYVKTATEGANAPLNEMVASEEKHYADYRESTFLAAQQLEIARQIAVENKYFNTEKCKNPYVMEIGSKIFNERYHPLGIINDEPLEIDMTDKPASLLIAAEKALMELSIKSQKKDRCAEDSEVTASLSQNDKNPQNKIAKTAKEKILYGEFFVKYKTPYRVYSPNHQGNYEIEELWNYPKIADRLQKIIGEDKEKSIQLTQLMIQLMSKGSPITSKDLLDLGVAEGKAKGEAEFVTKLCVNLIKETCRRYAAKEKCHIFPYASIQAKALLLAKQGVIHLTDLFKSHDTKTYQRYSYPTNETYGALFGIPTTNGEPIAAKDNVRHVEQKGRFINQFYTQTVLANADLSFFSENFPKKERCFTSSRQQILKELQTIYGGAEDMDNEGYSSEEEYLSTQLKK
jgi:hypothetical protein